MGSTRIKGHALKLDLGTTPASNFWADFTSFEIEPTEADRALTTFEDIASGTGYDFIMKGTAIQSTAPDSLWMYVWAHSGETVAYTYAPHGNAVPSVNEPHFIGQVKIGSKPKIGGEAGTDVEYEFDIEWKCTGAPTMVTGA